MERDYKRLRNKKALGKNYKSLLKWSKQTKLNINVFETGADYLREGRKQHNCIFTYLDGAIAGNYACLDWKIKNNCYTVQVQLIDKHYKIVQIYRTYNQEPVNKDVDLLQNKLNKAQIED